jgi:hypothetical protein
MCPECWQALANAIAGVEVEDVTLLSESYLGASSDITVLVAPEVTMIINMPMPMG